jgi:hypothetical protein
MRLLTSTAVAFCLSIPNMSPLRGPEALAVHVNLEFDRSITSETIKEAMTEEAAAIWRAYDVDLQWTERTDPAALCLDVAVERRGRHAGLVGSLSVLARTTLGRGLAAQASIRISFDAIDSLLGPGYSPNPLLHGRVVGLALGRVLAHEIGHVLLGEPTYHDPEGLMRATFFTDDLARPERSRFRLANRSVVRLRARIAFLSETQPSGVCAWATRGRSSVP